LHLHVVCGRFPIGISDGELVRGGPLGRDLETPRVGRPHFRYRWIEADGLRVDHVVADLCGCAAPNHRGSSVKLADAEPWATKLLKGELIVRMTLLVDQFGVAPLEFAGRLMTRDKKVGKITDHDDNPNDRIDNQLL